MGFGRIENVGFYKMDRGLTRIENVGFYKIDDPSVRPQTDVFKEYIEEAPCSKHHWGGIIGEASGRHLAASPTTRPSRKSSKFIDIPL